MHTLTNLQQLGIAQVSEFVPILPPLPESLSALRRLQSLVVEGAAFADGYPHCVRAMTGLTQLVLRGEWGMIAPPIEGLTRLQWLEVCAGIMDPQVCCFWGGNGRICRFLCMWGVGGVPFITTRICPPQSLAPLTSCSQLTVLLIGRCCLSSVPAAVSQLAGLQELDLAFNHLSKRLPGGAYLTDLRVLDLSHNRLNEIPRVLGNATKLKWLFVHHQVRKPGSGLQRLTAPLHRRHRWRCWTTSHTRWWSG